MSALQPEVGDEIVVTATIAGRSAMDTITGQITHILPNEVWFEGTNQLGAKVGPSKVTPGSLTYDDGRWHAATSVSLGAS